MPEGYGQFIPPEARGEQYQAANQVIDRESETELLTPPSMQREEVLNMSVEQVKTQFPKRYEMYVKLVRELRRHGNDNDLVSLTEKEAEDMKKWLLALNSVDNYIARHRSPKEGDEITLRGERQVDVFDDIRKFLERNGKEGYLKLPTGFGKTVLFTELVEATNLKTLVVVPTKLLIHQTAEKFTKFASDIKVGKVYGDEKDFGQQATLITYDSLIIGLKNGNINPADYDMVILDEAHLITGEGRAEAVARFPDAVKLGFTATPVYKPGEKEVSKVLGTEIHKLNIREAVEGGYLSPFTSIGARTEVDLSKVQVSSEGDYNQDQLDKAVNVLGRNKAAVDLYKAGFDGQMAVVYCVKIDHAQAVFDLFNKEGISAAVISGKTSDKEQEQILADYKSGKIKVLCNADLLIAGFDEQQASVCINLRPTKSIVVAEQRGGRVLRIDENNSNKHAYIIDFIDQGTEKSGQVLFPQVAEAVELAAKEKRPGGGGGGGGRVDLSHIKVDGIEVVIDQSIILEILRNLEKTEKLEIIKDLSFLKLAIKASGIKPTRRLQETYIEAYKLHPNWPSLSALNKIPEFKGMYDLWGVEAREIIKDVVALKLAIKNSGILPSSNLHDSYCEAKKLYPHWPSYPTLKSLPGFISMEDLWNIEKKKWTFALLKAEVQAAGIVPGSGLLDSYEEARKLHPDWPSRPFVARLPDFISFYDLFGLEEKVKIIKDLVTLKLAIKNSGISPGLNLTDSYREVRKLHPDWPSQPTILPGFISIEDLWGMEEKKWTLVDLRLALKAAGVPPEKNLAKSYLEVRKLHPDWPSITSITKLPDFISFADLWGIEK